MPTYGYRCPSCASEFELWQRMTDEARAECPSCGTASRRLFFPAGIVFKGGGFYKTDSRGAESSGATAKPDGEGKASQPDAGQAAKPADGPDSGSTPGSGGKPTPSAAPPAPPSAPAAAPKPASPAPSAPSGGSPPGKSA